MRATRLLSLSIAVAAASLLAHAQTFNQVEVTLPYAISAGTTQIPAGTYEIRPLATAPDTFGLYKDGVVCQSIVQATPIEKSTDVPTSVVLRVDGNHYQLSQLWIDGSTGYQFIMPPVPSHQNGEKPRSLAVKATRHS